MAEREEFDEAAQYGAQAAEEPERVARRQP